MLEIVVPMAGRGSRFAERGYPLPKPLIPVRGVPMIELVIENLRPSSPHRFTFLCQRDHLEEHGLGEKLQHWAPGSSVVPLDRVTEGAACTALLARDHIDLANPLMIANCDQYIDVEIDDYLAALGEGDDGLIMTMRADDPKWSFVGLDAAGRVERVAEKEVISHDATVGVYNFRRAADFVSGAEEMIEKDLRVNNEFYVAPVYNLLIARGAVVGIYPIGSVGAGMYGLGIPEDLMAFELLDVAGRAVAGRCAA